jgi:hypothetical protein
VAMDYGQVEDGAFATSPILTTSASVTRSADVASMSTLTNPILNYPNFTFYANGAINGVAANNGFGVFQRSDGGTPLRFLNINNTSFGVSPGPVGFISEAVVRGKDYRFAASIVNQSSVSVTLNGSSSGSQNLITSTHAAYNTIPSSMPLFFIGRIGDIGFWNGTLKRITLLSKAQSHTALQAITSGAT